MDPLHARLDTLESQVHTLTQHTQNATRRLRWWRGIACGLMVLGLLGWGLPVGLAREDAAEKDKGEKGLAHRVAALEKLLKHFSRERNEIFITGANLHIVNGLGSTDCADKRRADSGLPERAGQPDRGLQRAASCTESGEENIRTGSHNVVVGQRHNFSRFGGLVVGAFNTISGDFAVVSGGRSTRPAASWPWSAGGRQHGQRRGRGQRGVATRPAGSRLRGQRRVRQYGERDRRHSQRRGVRGRGDRGRAVHRGR